MSRDYSKFQHLSPFEIKDELINLATEKLGSKMLNAGRGNPNFISTTPREAFFYLGMFALQEAERFFSFIPGLGAIPENNGMDLRFDAFVNAHCDKEGVKLLKKMVAYVWEKMGISKNDLMVEFVNGILGDTYPVPPRILKYTEKIAAKYVLKEMGYKKPTDTVDLMATEGGTAAMTYIFQSLSKNGIIKKGDKIALGMPIFVPYIEIPHLAEYELVEVNIAGTHEGKWQYDDKELDKLLDPEIKAFFVVNPTNPASVKIKDSSLKKIAEIVKKRPDLIILTDDVYATFSNDFESLFTICPKNTILVYSYSKYFGSTGWRLGVIALAKENIIDELIRKLPENISKELDHRYSPVAVEPRKMKFIDRMVADSRSIGLNHTAGPSTPQQIQMALFSLSELIDENAEFKKAMKKMKHDRYFSLYQGIGIDAPHDDNDVHYYHIIPMADLGGRIYGKEFASWMEKSKKAVEVLFDMAELGVVLLPADGFGVAEPLSVRVSLSNLTAANYLEIGSKIRALIDTYYKEFKK
jgi:aspartate 4-decarboxylase